MGSECTSGTQDKLDWRLKYQDLWLLSRGVFYD